MTSTAFVDGSRSDVVQAFTGLSTDEMEILDAADLFARKTLYPLAQRMDDEEWWPEGVFAEIGDAGYLGITAPEAYGGLALDVFASGLILQAFSRWNHALALAWVAHENLCMNNILRNGNKAQCEKFLPAMNKGRAIGALGLTEPGAGSDALGSMRTTARFEGDHYVLDGTKMFITNGPVADVLLVYAKTDKKRGSQGISAFIVERSYPGFAVAQKLVKMGFRGSQTAELVFDGCRVPAENLVGEKDCGIKVVMSGLDLERAMIGPICLGIAERALSLSLDYARQRKQFDRPIADFQMVQSMLAEMYVWVESMRVFVYQGLRAASVMKEEEGGRGDIHKITAAAVMYSADTLNKVLNHAVQVHGGVGYIWESEINRLYRAIKLLEIGAGTTEVRKLIIAGELLRSG